MGIEARSASVNDFTSNVWFTCLAGFEDFTLRSHTIEWRRLLKS
jgi:hypothetical protein